MTTNWREIQFGDVTGDAGLFLDGDWIETKDQDPNGDVRLIQLADIGEGQYLDRSSRFLTSEKAAELKCTFLEKGDLLVARMPDPLGRACVFPGDPKPSVTAVDVCIVRPDTSAVDIHWLKWVINSPRFRSKIERYITGTTRKRISRKNLQKILLKLPHLTEQRRIAAILDKADGVRRKRQQTLDLAEQFLRSAFLDMFGDPVTNPKRWPVKKLGDLVDGPVRNGLSPAKSGTHAGEVLTLSAITGAGFRPEYRKAAFFGIEPPCIKMVDTRDFLICRGNGNIDLVGRGRFPDESLPGVLFPDTMIGFRLDMRVVAKAYLQLVWETKAVRNQIVAKSRTTSGIHKVNQQTLKTISIPLPPVEKQRRFEKLASKIHDTKKALASTDADALFGSLVQRAFRGEVA